MNPLLNVTWRELRYNLLSWRMLLLFALLMLSVVGAAYGLAQMAVMEREIPNLTRPVTDPAEVMTLVTAFIHFFGSLVIIVMSFDSVANERIQNTRYLLLVRPIDKASLALGKFLGNYLALLVPFTLAVGASALIVRVKVGPLPWTGVLGFLVFTMMYVAVFVAIQQTLSSLTKTTGSAVLSGISLWLLFVLFWPLIPGGVGTLLGIELETPEGYRTDAYLALIDKFTLLNPTMLYQACVGIGFDAWTLQGVTMEATFAAFFLWTLASIVVYVYVFSTTIDQD